MSGGYFEYENSHLAYEMEGRWQDEELNELFYDLFCADLWGNRSGGVATALDFWLSGDITEEKYREHVKKFKDKWFGRTDEQRVAFYQDKMQEYCDKLKYELSVYDTCTPETRGA